ncbi:OB-fold nucleic acid binding domain-containing protein [Candidatus Pacearchaeota archaeon]|nr:OB-fold nucleic acid binding domain-containing protein [Candidatus Pacearchaeota archaeon]
MSDYKRHVAYKLKIGDVLQGKRIFDADKFSFIELGNKKINRINIIANIIERYSSAEKSYISLTIDDASGQIRIKIFGDDVNKFSNISQGDTILVIGLIRVYNDELYITPEIMKKKDPKYLLVRKLEFDKIRPKEVDKNIILALSDKIIGKIKDSEPNGIGSDKLMEEFKEVEPSLINQEIKKALEEGIIYEPRPGIVRYLG